jgi:hypothetical protein
MVGGATSPGLPLVLRAASSSPLTLCPRSVRQ